MNKIEIYEWLQKIIASANNDFHFESCKNLIELFKIKFPNAEHEALSLELNLQEMILDNHNVLL